MPEALEESREQHFDWRGTAKSIPPLYWAVGLLRYLRFRRELRQYQEAYAAQDAHHNPPPMLRYRVHRGFDEDGYSEMGRVLARVIVDALQRQQMALDHLDVLDFACGPGRVIRDFHRLVPGARLVGSDIDSEAIEWTRANLADIGSFHVNAVVTPTDFVNDAFDVIYSISLFTHLDEASQDAWLQELVRLLRPGGVLVTTVHGRAAMASCTLAERAELERDGIAFRVDRKGRFKLDGLPDFYQTTFHSRAYIERHWTQFLDLKEYREGGIHGHQDLVVLAKT